MGINATIEVTFDRDISVSDIVHLLMERGWSANWAGKFRYWLNEPGFDWFEEPYENRQAILERLERIRDQMSITIFFVEDEDMWDATLSFSKTDKSLLIVDCPSGRKISPYFRAAIDFSWYIAKLLPNPETSSLGIARVLAASSYM